MISCNLRVAILKKLIYELRVTLFELNFQKNEFTSSKLGFTNSIAALGVEVKNL